MRYPVNDFNNKWYIAQGFGEKTDYGYHDGIDLNLKTGGDTDLGQPLLAIANGQVTSVHEHTTIPSFGKHIHIKFESPFGTRFVHYAHCQKILVPVNAQVTEGQQIAELGKSGTKVAHCHFAIKNQPTGVDGIAKTQEDLAKWEDPIVFIEKCIQKEKEVLNEQALKDIISDLEIKLKTANDQLATKVLETDEYREQLRQQEADNKDLSEQLVKAREERNSAIGEQKTLEGKIETLSKEVTTLQEEKSRLLEALKAQQSLENIPTIDLMKELFRRLIKRG